MSIQYYNGQFTEEPIAVDSNDRGYYFGDGIYEVVRVYDGRLFTVKEHMKRLVRSAAEIKLNITQEVDDYIAICEKLVDLNGIKTGNIYLQITRGVAPRTHAFPDVSEPVTMAYIYEFERPEEELMHGIRTVTAEDYRWLRCDIKSLNLLANVLNTQKAKEADALEAIQLRDGIVTEGASSNAYIVRDGAVVTHPANELILNGITRQVIKQLAEEEGIPFKEERFDLDALYGADEVFISSSVEEVMPVVQIDDKKFEIGPVTRQLQQAFEEKIYSAS